MFDRGRHVYITRLTYDKKQRKYNVESQLNVVLTYFREAGIILGLGLASERRRYTL